MSLAISLLLIVLSTASASRVEEEHKKLLLEAEKNGNVEHSEEHGRELWWWKTSDSQEAGQRCGTRNHCSEGLECTQVAFGNRCIAPTSCLKTEFESFGNEVDVEVLKKEILDEAGTTKEELAAAAQDGTSGRGLLRNGSVQAFVKAVQNHMGIFDKLNGIVTDCSEVEEEQLPEVDFFPPEGTESPSSTPTKHPSAAPSAAPTIVKKQTLFTGFTIEGGALLEGSLTVFWERESNLDFPPIYVKGCMGVGPTIGADISLIAIIADTDDPKEIQCLSTLYDVDIQAGVGVGYGIGVCMLSEPTFVYQEIKFGAGVGIGASTFSVCDGQRISNGYDDGIDSVSLSNSYDGHGHD